MNLKIRRLRFTYKSILFFSIIMFMSCKKDSRIFEQGDYPPEIANILVNKCATSGCHNDASYQGAANFNITTYASLFKGSNNGSPIIPFRSDFSLLCNFINTYPELGLINLPTMPLNEKALSKTEVKTIKDWIDKGAPDKNGKIMWSDNLLRKKYYVL